MTEARRPRLGAFGAGAIVGFLLPVVVALAIHFTVGVEAPQMRPLPFNVLIESSGADVSAHSGQRVIVSHEHGSLTQTCREGCDDLRVEADSGENVFRVRVEDAAGKCLACDAGQYVDSGYGAPITRWQVSGAQVLAIRTSTLRRKADGSMIEDVTPVEATPLH
jgi:hypothetical protein